MKLQNHKWPKLALTLSLLVGAIAMPSTAQITNYFTDGGDSDPTPLDQYPSAPGNQWTTAWQSQLGSGAALVAGVVTNPPNGTPLNGGGNYLQWQLGGGTAASTIRRQFSNAGSVDITKPYVIEFDYRTDMLNAAGVANSNSFNNANDQITISQNGAPTSADVTGRSTFWVKAQGAANASAPGLAPLRWSFFEGALQGTTESRGLFINSTNVPFRTNTTYHFRFDVDQIARDYEGTVSDGVNTFNTKQATGRRLRWRNYAMASDAANLSNTTIMTFTARNNTTTETNIQSMDNLTIYQLSTNLWPVTLAQVTPIRAESFYPITSNLVFTAETYGTNSLPASGAQLVLNGVSVGGLTFSGTDSSQSRTITYNGALTDNTAYEGSLIVADQAGRSTTLPFFFDTFNTNSAIILEAENFNFDPTQAYCQPSLQTDGTRPDRYIQNWLYGGPSGLDPSGATNVVDSYFSRDALLGVDYFATNSIANTTFRSCVDVGMRNSTTDEYERPWIENMGINEYLLDRIPSGNWYNYTHEWPAGNYKPYLRVGVAFTSISVDLHLVTSDYTVSGQTTERLGGFILTNAPARREILKNYQATSTNGLPMLLPLSGKKTLRLTSICPPNETDSLYLNRIVFVPVVAPLSIVITNVSLVGSDLSFSINTTAATSYTIQTNSSVSGGTWGTLTNFTGTGSNMIIHHNPVDPNASQLFYRAVSP